MIDELMVNIIGRIPLGVTGMVILLGIVIVSLGALGKGADLLVDEAVALSYRWGVPKMLIGATTDTVTSGKVVPKLTIVAPINILGTPHL